MKNVSLVLAMPVLGWLAPVRVVLRKIGVGLSTASLISALRAMEKQTPSFTVPSAVLRFAGVIRFTAPIWSFAPQRFQLEICFCRRTKSSGVELGRAVCAAAGLAAVMAAPAASCWIALRRDGVLDSESDMAGPPLAPISWGLPKAKGYSESGPCPSGPAPAPSLGAVRMAA